MTETRRTKKIHPFIYVVLIVEDLDHADVSKSGLVVLLYLRVVCGRLPEF